MKLCKTCGLEKPPDAFARCAANKDGLQFKCRSCHSAYDKAKYAADPEKERQRVQDYRASDPERTRSLARAGYHSNIEARRAYQRELRIKDPVRKAAYSAKWYEKNAESERKKATAEREANPEFYRQQERERRDRKIEQYRQKEVVKSGRRRARQRGNPIEPVDVERIIARDGLRCHICKGAVPRNEISLDHLVPVVEGGAHAEWNLAVAHGSCNSRRGPGRLPAQLHLPLDH